MSSNQWYLWNFEEKRADGPFAWGDIRQMAQSGLLAPDSQVSDMGSGAWQPAGSVAGLFPGSVEVPRTPEGHRVHYAGFWIRFLAVMIDGVLLGIVGSVIDTLLRATSMPFAQPSSFDFDAPPIPDGPWFETGDIVSMVFGVAIGLTYYTTMHASARGATLGKRALGLRVVDTSFRQISPGRSAGRYFGTWLSGLVLSVGYLMAAFHPKKRALHDLLADTYVIYDTRLPRNAHLR